MAEGYHWSLATWIGFNALLATALLFDLFVLQRKDHVVTIKESLLKSLLWTAVAAGVGAWIFFEKGNQAGGEYVTAYVIERALSIDNLFVFLVIFSYFKVPREYQSRALTLGILGALVTRALFIVVGVAAISLFEPVLYILGAFLIFTAVRIAVSHNKDVDPSKNLIFRLAKRFFKVTDRYDGHNFFTVENGVRVLTPMLLVVLVIESTDVLFAIDSVPSVLAITTDGFLVWSSNTMAVLGLRPLYFVLAGMVQLFRYLQYGLAVILAFVGAKMIFNQATEQFDLGIHIDKGVETYGALGIILLILAMSVLMSKLIPAKQDATGGTHAAGPVQQELTHPASPTTTPGGGANGRGPGAGKT
jgi:tellurite resistance protein TerC